ncbi:MAG: hypothetical protein H6862_00925 [Rhodospirillales bacterium]|nr:hypothetical protein [Rhodospirillales bacterium]
MSKSYQRQKLARQELDQIWSHPETVCVIHYSCESFYDRPDGSSPRITSIAVRNLKTAQTQSFSIHKFGELRSLAANDLENHYDDLEKEMLESFYKFVGDKRDYKWLHWNMRDENYGFHALELRAKILGLDETKIHVIQDDKKFDLARILISVYGRNYASHPRLQSVMELNKIHTKNFKTGEEEAHLFQSRDYVALHQSTLSKVDIVASICNQTYEGTLKTNASFWDRNGGSITGIIHWRQEHPAIISLSILANIIFGINLIWGLLK